MIGFQKHVRYPYNTKTLLFSPGGVSKKIHVHMVHEHDESGRDDSNCALFDVWCWRDEKNPAL